MDPADEMAAKIEPTEHQSAGAVAGSIDKLDEQLPFFRGSLITSTTRLRSERPFIGGRHCDYRCGAAARASGQEWSSFVSYHSGRERIAGSSPQAGSRLIRSIARWYFSMR
jgi:hypothetical protein